MSIKVSIITPCLNSKNTIRNTIESILGQTYKNIEYIIVDGQSTDGTLDVIREYQTLFEGRLECISEMDTGIYEAMNKGILHATGEVIGIIGSDDWYELDAVEKVVKCFNDTGAEAVYGEVWIINSDYQREYHTYQSVFPPHTSLFIRQRVYHEHGNYDLRYRIAADRELILRFMAKGVRFEYIDGILADFRTTGISSTEILERAKEIHEIDLQYWGKCPEDILNKNEIEERNSRAELLYICHQKPQAIRETLSLQCNISEGVAIFGAGDCGKELESVLRECNIPVRFIVDNDKGKWGLERNGVKVISPEILRYYTGYVIVAVSRFQEEIFTQLQSYFHPGLSWGTLGEIRQDVIDQNAELLLSSY